MFKNRLKTILFSLVVFSLVGFVTVSATFPDTPAGSVIGGWLGTVFNLSTSGTESLNISSKQITLPNSLVDEIIENKEVVTKEYVDSYVDKKVEALGSSNNSGVSMISGEIGCGSYGYNRAWASKQCRDLVASAAYAMNGNTTTTYSDWKLPSVEELGQFIYSGLPNTGHYVWTATPFQNNSSFYIIVEIQNGAWTTETYNQNGCLPGATTYVRCVR